MAPPHRGEALMAALAAAALLLMLDSPVAGARLRSPPGALKDGVYEKSPEVGNAPFRMTEAERLNTLKVLQAFAAAMPSLGWSGDNFCSWSGVVCTEVNVHVIVTRLEITGTLPEMPDDVDYSMVRLDQIHFFGYRSGVTGTLPSSWGKLSKVRTINLVYTGISGTLPASWSSMEAIEQIIISSKRITGTLPEAWSALRNVRRIHLQGCSLYGSLPEVWAQMPSLERLDLRNNKFCGCVPTSLRKSTSVLMGNERKHGSGYCSTAEACAKARMAESGTARGSIPRSKIGRNNVWGAKPGGGKLWTSKAPRRTATTTAPKRPTTTTTTTAPKRPTTTTTTTAPKRPTTTTTTTAPTSLATTSTCTTTTAPYNHQDDHTSNEERVDHQPPTTTHPRRSDTQCSVPNCISCVLGESIRCSVCSYGYQRSADMQCRTVSSQDAAAFPLLTAAEAAVCVAVVVVSAMLA